jgi:PAS domain S-box-containing protein
MGMRVGELARRTGVGVSTLRAWERRFKFLEPQRSPTGHRLYVEADVERVDAVLRLVAEGLTLPAAITRVASVGTGALPDGEAETLLYHQILQAADRGIWVIRDGRTRFANRRMAEIMGSSVDELVALPILDVFDPKELPLVKERTELVRAGNRLHFTQELRRADRSTFIAEMTTTPLFNQAGRYDGAVVLVEDVTARNEAETQARLRATLLDSVGEAVTAQTFDGKVVYVNAAAERLFGWRAAEVIGRESRDVFPSSDGPKVGTRIHALLQQGKTYSGRYKMFRRDGSEFVAQLTSAPTIGADGSLVGYVGVISDQTERDQRERSVQTRERQAETLALLGAQALRQRVEPRAATLILTEAVEATRRLLHADHAIVLDAIADADQLHVLAASPEINAPIEVPSGSRSFAGYTALARKVVVVDNTEYDRRFDPLPTQPGRATASAIGAPVFGPDGIRGVLIAESFTPNRFDYGDGHFIQGMANIIGMALLD